MQIISLSAMGALGMQDWITTQMQTKIILPLSCLQAPQGFFHIVQKGTSPLQVAEPFGSVQCLHWWHWPETNSQVLKSGIPSPDQQFFWGANIVEKEEPKKIRIADSTPGNITQKYERGAWKKAEVCHHTFLSNSQKRSESKGSSHASLTYRWGQL